MRKALAQEAVFLLWRLAGRLDASHTLAVAKTLTGLAHAKNGTVQVAVADSLARRLDDWSEPVQIRFGENEDGWDMYIRPCEQQVAISETIRARAARQ